jgi:uncharacterized membrane protein
MSGGVSALYGELMVQEHSISGLEETAEPSAKAAFDALLTPNRSLSKPGFVAMMLAVGVISLCLGIYFLLQGAWPVFGFFGLDIVLLYVAMRLNYRSGRMNERVRLTERSLEVRRESPSGNWENWSFNPFWVRLSCKETPHGRYRITLAQHGVSVTVGSFLAPDEQREFATALEHALARVGRVR